MSSTRSRFSGQPHLLQPQPQADPQPPHKKALVDVFVEIMQRRDGKDKSLKIIQYTGKLILRLGKTKLLARLFQRLGVAARVAPLVKELSMFRKIIKLFDWLKSARELTASKKCELVDCVDLATEVFDDLYLFARLGILSKWFDPVFARYADVGWFVAIVLNLNTKLAAKQMDAQQKLDVAKLVCDFIFCSVDVFELPADAFVQTLAGLASGVFSYIKIYQKVR